MKRLLSLPGLTAAASVLFLAYIGYSVIAAFGPTADDLAGRSTEVFIPVDEFSPGEVRTFDHEGLLLHAWRRNETDMALAKTQDEPMDWLVQSTALTDGSVVKVAYDRDLTIDGEWFFVAAKSSDGLRCRVLTRTGKYAGFFDPCEQTHYDIAGRVREGPSRQNLVVIAARLTANGKTLALSFDQVPAHLR